MKTIRRNAAVIAVTAVVAGLGIGGVMAAQASSPDPSGGHTQTEESDGDGEVDDATEVENHGETDDETYEDGTERGPDANPEEPGHQDASDADDSDGGAEPDDDGQS